MFLRNILLFLLLVFIVIILQYDLLKPTTIIGLTPDDWSLRFHYKILGSSPFAKLSEVWQGRGAYTTFFLYYIGLLENFLGFNYHLFQTANITFKALATLAIFPLVLILFKNRLLAFLTTILFGISYSSVGSLEFVVKGSDYIAIFWMCLFLITYYRMITKESINSFWLILSLIMIILTLTFSTIRLFPLLTIPILVEIYLLINNQNLSYLKNMLIRMSVLYLPFAALMVYAPNSVLGFLQSPFNIYSRVIEGNWHLILSPFSGMGYTFIASDNWSRIFGLLSADDFKKYLYYLAGGPTVIFGLLTLMVALIKSRKPISFFLNTFLLNLFLEIIIFFIASHYKYLPLEQRMLYDPSNLYSALFGIYILVLGFACFVEWLNKKDDKVLMALWIGPAFLFIFTFLTWAFAPIGTNFSSTSYYLVVSTLGSSLFVGAFLIIIHNRIKQIKAYKLGKIFSPLIFLLIIPIFIMSYKEIHTFYDQMDRDGRSSLAQMDIQSRFKLRIKDIDLSQANLFYFDPSEIHTEGRFYTESFLSSFPFWMHFDGNKLIDGCLEVTYQDRDKLVRLIRVDEGKIGFLYRSLCVENGKSGYKEIFYKPENFYAFKLKNKDFIDIRKDLLKELGI